MRIYSFAPIADKNATTLILGSMPGRASLTANQYYAHSRNAFWPIMAALLNFDAAISYERRARLLRQHNIALWDVLQSCVREGSLDTRIEKQSVVANDFAAFFKTHKNIKNVFFNGTQAERLFNRHVQGVVNLPELTFMRLPSTSPANAGMNVDNKRDKWRMIIKSDEVEPV